MLYGRYSRNMTTCTRSPLGSGSRLISSLKSMACQQTYQPALSLASASQVLKKDAKARSAI